VGNPSPTNVPLSTTSHPEPNPGPKFSSSLKDTYNGIKERMSHTAQNVKDEAAHGTQKMKEGGHSVMEKGKKMMEKGMGLKEKGKEKMMHMKEGITHKVEEFEKRFEETGLGPVTGVEKSVEYATPPHRVGSEADAAIGNLNIQTGTAGTPEVKVEPIDSIPSAFASSSFPSSSPSPPFGGSTSASTSASDSESEFAYADSSGVEKSMGGKSGEPSVRGQEDVTPQSEVPVYGVSNSASTSAPNPKINYEDEAVILAPVDAVLSQPVSSSSSSPSSSPSSSIESGIDGPASEHAAKVQRDEGMSSNEMLGTGAIGRGKEGGKGKARMGKNMGTAKTSEQESQQSRPQE